MSLTKEIICLLLFIGLACCREDREADESKNDPQERYYERIPDAPLDLYCYLNVKLDADDRLRLCSLVMEKYSNNLTLNVGLKISNNKLEQVDLQSLYFDSAGNTDVDSVSVELLSPIFDSLRIDNIPTLKAIVHDNFVLRMQLERLCPGYVFINQPAIGRLKAN